MLSHNVFNFYLGRVQHAAEYLAGGSIVLPAKKVVGGQGGAFQMLVTIGFHFSVFGSSES